MKRKGGSGEEMTKEGQEKPEALKRLRRRKEKALVGDGDCEISQLSECECARMIWGL